MFGSLRTKLMLSHLGLVLLAMVVLAFYLVRSMEAFYLHTIQSGMRDEVALLTERLGPELATGNRDRVRQFLAGMDPALAATVLVADADGMIIGSTDPGDLYLVGRPGLSRGLSRALRSRIEQTIQGVVEPSADVVYTVTPIEWEGRQVGYLRVSYRLATLYDQLGSLMAMILIGLAVAAGVGLLVSLVLAHSLSAPARRLVAAARALSAGDLSYRIRPRGRDEIREAGRAFDGLADQLQRLERERQQLLGDVSHDLHSSITGVAMAVEALQQGAVDDPGLRPLLLDGLASHARRLHRMADDLLEAARLEAGRLRLRVAPLEPERLLKAVAAEFAAEAAERSVQVAVRAEAGLPVIQADAERLAQALGNLVENAIRHSPERGTVTVGATAADGECRFLVLDQGSGIAESDLPRLFDRFNRFLEGRPGRLGFGLAIAKGLVEAHGGRIEVESKPGVGTSFAVVLPVVWNREAGGS